MKKLLLARALFASAQAQAFVTTTEHCGAIIAYTDTVVMLKKKGLNQTQTTREVMRLFMNSKFPGIDLDIMPYVISNIELVYSPQVPVIETVPLVARSECVKALGKESE